MSVDLATEHVREPVVSCDTALPCLVRLGVAKGDHPEIEAVRQIAVLDGNTLPASRLTELVGKFGHRAECMRLDWDRLTKAALNHPILIFLKNTNAVLVTGTESAAAEAVTVWDPLHSDDETLTVQREDFERAWSGDALVVVRRPSAGAEASSGSSRAQDIEELEPLPERVPIADTEPPPNSASVARRTKSQWLVAIGLAVAAALSLPLWLHAVTDSAGRTGIRAKEATPEVPQSTAEAIAHAMEPGAATAPIGLITPAAPSAAMPALGGSPGGPAAADPPTTAASMPEAPPAIASPAPVAAATAPAEAMPPVAPSVAVPALSDSPGGPAAAVPRRPGTSRRESASAMTSPAQAEPPAGPAVATAPAVAIPSHDPSTAAPSTGPLSAEPRLSDPEIAALLAHGDVLVGTGDLAAARTFYERAADAGDAQAAVRLGETYDPSFLDHAHLRGVRGNAATALSWYRRARDLGAAEAEVLLNSLEAK
jgi:hypothetical protein